LKAQEDTNDYVEQQGWYFIDNKGLWMTEDVDLDMKIHSPINYCLQIIIQLSNQKLLQTDVSESEMGELCSRMPMVSGGQSVALM
jgi:hypothetical protein